MSGLSQENEIMTKTNLFAAAPALSCLVAGMALGLATMGVLAEADKAVSVEAVPVLPAFNQWVDNVAVVAVPQPPATGITTVVPLAPAAAAGEYEPWPVILGTPDLPLLGRRAGNVWGESFNYQGMHVRLLVLDATGRSLQVRGLNQLPRPGERFRIRVTPSFSAVAEVDLVNGGDWQAKRAGQVYPKPGMSVQMNPGETVDLPLEPTQFFVMGGQTDKLVLGVRHTRATDQARTDQPAYRQDVRSGSSFLQLVRPGRYPAFEQLIAARR